MIRLDSFYTDYDVCHALLLGIMLAFSVMRSENHELLRKRQARLGLHHARLCLVGCDDSVSPTADHTTHGVGHGPDRLLFRELIRP